MRKMYRTKQLFTNIRCCPVACRPPFDEPALHISSSQSVEKMCVRANKGLLLADHAHQLLLDGALTSKTRTRDCLPCGEDEGRHTRHVLSWPL